MCIDCVLVDRRNGGVGGVWDSCASVVVYEGACVLRIEDMEGVIMSDENLYCGSICGVVDVIFVGVPWSQVLGQCDCIISVFRS